jgi:hypothetical protein
MHDNRRKSQRFAINGRAKIHFGVGTLPRDCTIIDISDGGVRLIVENVEIPENFTLIFSSGEGRECRLAWRIGCEFGAQYLGSAMSPRRNRVAA